MKSNLLLLHGALGSEEYFHPLLPFLSAHFSVHSFNFEGHGGRISNLPFTIDLFVENTFTYLKEQNLEKVDIFGYSMGGYVALKLAFNYPNLVNKIVTLGTKFEWNPDSAAQEVKMLDPTKIKEKIPAFANQLEKRHAPLDWTENMRKTADMMLRMGNEAVLSDEHIHKIQHKVTIGIGEKDKMVSIPESERIVNLLPRGKLYKLPNTPHPIDQIEATKIAEYITSALN
jgi:pimeloyl-ACP methyl ester carboxylesterase